MNQFRLLLVLGFVAFGWAQESAAQQSVARMWNEQLLQAIRIDTPHPPKHARNLHHTAVAMYDAWAAYDATAVGYLYNEKVSPLPVDIEAARAEAISYAAYRVLRARFAGSPNASTSLAAFDSQLTSLGYSPATGQAAVTNGTTPAEVGRRIGQMVLNQGATDGFDNLNYPQAYNATLNPNLNVPMPVLGTNVYFQTNMQLGYGIPSGTDPNLWQPLSLSVSVTQNGIPIPGGTQSFLGVQSLSTQAFSLTRSDSTKPWIDIGPPAHLGTATDATYKANALDVLEKSAVLNDATLIDISPASMGNNTLGADDGAGYASNPVPGGAAYTPTLVKRGDLGRVLAEFWADGPHSETPPGHWHVIANEVADMPGLQKRIGGAGPTVNNLEWDVKTYLAMAGAVHDAACAAWSLKRYYSGPRPITMIRYMCSKGQSSNPALPSYTVEGIPLVPGVVELITASTVGTAQSPGKHYQIWDVGTNSYQPGGNYINQIAVYSWPGEDPNNPPATSGLPATTQNTLRWMLGKDWLPFQRKTFNTPAFPGYISGHSTFSRAAAEVLALITGSPYFPGGFHHHTITANSLQIDLGPSTNVDLQWASYYDAADQAGISRRYGGIHPTEDDLPARQVGSQAGISAFTKAEKFWSGTIQAESVQPAIAFQPDGSAVVTWPRVPGRIYQLRSSTDYTTWTDVAPPHFATTTTGSYTITSPVIGAVYEVVETTPTVARMWNEQLLQAIRIDTPHPPKHARNLFHLATAMYDAWAAYDTTAVGYIHHERATAGDIAASRREAMSYAAYRVLHSRFSNTVNAATSLAAFDAQMSALGYDTGIKTQTGGTPAAVGNRIAATILAWGLTDGSNEAGNYLDPAYFNPQPPMIVLQGGLPQGYGVPAGTDPNLWQPLAFDAAFTQNGLQADLIQKYVGVTWLQTAPFAHSRADSSKPWLDPGPPAKLGTATDAEYKIQAMDVLRKSSQLNSTQLIDISPGAYGNNPLGQENGTGHPVNPATGQPYASNVVKLGDLARVLAEFWADGPDSETPPGHWHVLANEVSDNPLTVKKIGGAGPVVDDLEWDVKMYFAVSAATHDAACAAWGIKRYYESARPVTMIRYMCSKGQSSDPGLPSYNVEGIPLETNVCELITSQSVGTAQNPGKHYQIWSLASNGYVYGSNYINQVAVFAWPGEPADRATQTSPLRWMLGTDWLPYQRETFNTPAFPGYISGHSTFSRAAAEVLASITGSEFFPGGINHFTAPAQSFLVFERGPSDTVDLQWATYFDASDQAGISRRYGGIHPQEDDLPGRVIGSQCGKQVWTLARKYWDGSILAEQPVPAASYQPDGSALITVRAQRGMYYRLESSTDLATWTPLTTDQLATDSTITLTDPSASELTKFYRVVWDATAP